MSSIDAILFTFRKTLEEKKQPLNEQYEVTSQWLARELDLVRKLVQHDPRDPTQNFFEEMTLIPVVEVPQNKKRKSPETSSEIKLSPEQKRCSVDIKELLVAFGLPADLNKLKKEQLLDELNKRGVKQFTMKNLKNELIDALEHAIAAEKRNGSKPEHDMIESMVSSEQETVSVPISVENIIVHIPEPVVAPAAPMMEPTSAMKPLVRQGSLMDEFRKKVYTNNAVDAENAQQKQKIENEFRNRQERHRDSIARKSQILEVPPSAQELEKENRESEENVTVEEEIQASKLPFVSEANTVMDIVSPMKESSRPEETKEEEAEAEEENIPEEEEKEEDIVCEGKDDEEAIENNNHNEYFVAETETCEPEKETTMAPQKEEKEVLDEEKEEISDIEEESGKEISTSTMLSQQDSIFQATNNSQSSTKSSLSSTNSGTSHTEPTKKPLNLVGNASSFLEKQPKKPVIAALEKAKLLKEQEELRELKKKEMKAAKLQAVSAASNTNNTTSSAANKEKDKNDPRSPWGKMAKGISKVADKVYTFGKKPIDTATTTTAPAAVTAKSAVTVNTNAKPSFDVRAVESKTSLSAAPVVANSSTSTSIAPVVESTSSLSHVQTTTSHVTTSHPTMPPKSVVKDIVSNYHNLVNHTNNNNNAHTHFHDANTDLTSPVRPLPPIVHTAATATTASTSSVTLATNAPIAPTPITVSAPLVAAVSPASVAADVPKTAPMTLMASHSAPTSSTTPVVAEQRVLRDQVISPTATTTVAKVQEVDDDDDYDPANNYEIEDTPDSDSDGGSGTEDEDESDKKKQQIPEWARGDKLREALERQYGLNGHTPMDPDLIFPEVQSCSLEEIFGRREGLSRKYNARTSSAHWDADELTLVEKRQYRVHMGYDNPATQQSTAPPRKLH